MNIYPERRFVPQKVLTVSSSQSVEIFPAQSQNCDILEIVIQVYSANVPALMSVAILTGQAGYPQTPPWIFASGGFISDPGFPLLAGDNIRLNITVINAGTYTINYMIRYRQQGCGPAADTAIRGAVVSA